MKQHEKVHNRIPERQGVCPTCGQFATFTFLGEQRWPPRVAEAMGFTEVMHLWTCSECLTTISEPAESCH